MSIRSVLEFLTRVNPKLRARLCAALTGLMLTLSFPPIPAWWLAWISLIPLLWALAGKSRREAFILGMIAGLTHSFTLVYWIVVVLQHYGGLPWPASIGVLVLFCLYLSMYPAVFALLARDLRGGRFAVLGLSALWVSTELARAKALTGFPWCLLGHSQFARLSLIQVSDFVGVYGISFLIVAVNVVLYLLLFDLRSFSLFHRKVEAALVVILLGATLAYGKARLRESEGPPGRSIKVAVVQGNIDQSVKWNPAYQKKTIAIYERLTREATSFHPDLILWPETAVPFFFQEQDELANLVRELPKELHTTLIFGSPAFRMQGKDPQFYNRAYMLSPRGKVAGWYDKIHLVPFGEYVPLKEVLFFVNRLVPAAGDFASGEIVKPMAGDGFSAGTLICYEVVFPELAREEVKHGADLLVNLTNDAWFGKTSAPYQHLCMAAFRAVENRTALVRAANTGISAFITPTGEIAKQSGIFRRDLLEGQAALRTHPPGFYTRHGDLFAWLLFAYTSIQFLYVVWYMRKKKNKE